MTSARMAILVELLGEAIKEGRRLPDGAWEMVQQLVSWTAPELVIVSADLQRVLLQFRQDDASEATKMLLRPEYSGTWKGWDGFHFDGGYMRPLESVQVVCNRLAREVGITAGVQILGAAFIRKWLDHPYAFPVSIGVVCQPVGSVPERNDLKFFGENNIPRVEDFLHPSHHEFLLEYFQQLEDPKPFIPILETQYFEWPECRGYA